MIRVLLDCDGVLADFLTPCLAIVNGLSGTKHELSHVTSWNVFDSLGVSPAVKSKTYKLMKEEGWCWRLPVMPGAKEAVADLMKISEVHCVTSPMNGPHWEFERRQWLEHHFDIDVVHSTEHKFAVSGDLLVDDKTSHLEKWLRAHPGGTVVRWDPGTRAHLHEEFAGVTTNDWNYLLAVVNKLTTVARPFRTWGHP